MASFEKLASGKWRAQIQKNGKRESKSFVKRTAAKAWAAQRELELDNPQEAASKLTFGEVLDRYAREVSAKKRGGRPEIIRIERIKRDKISKIALSELAPSDLADWRDRRLKEIQSSSVKREMEQFNSVLTHAVREWGLISENPMKMVRRPRGKPPRDRRPTADEIKKLKFAAGTDLTKRTARSFHAWLFAIETGMRAGEIASLTWEDIDIPGRSASLRHTKNGDPRQVPLSKEAVRLLEELPRDLEGGAFGLKTDQISSLWRKVKLRAGIEDLTFHDSRHEAITRLARKLDVLDLARMVGHRDIRQLQTYYNPTTGEIASRLD